jgi:hypothetical protein
MVSAGYTSLNFIPGTVAYRSWQGHMYMAKLAGDNVEEAHGLKNLLGLMWCDSTARRHM